MIFAGRSGSINIPSKYKSVILVGGGMNSGVITSVTPTNCTVTLIDKQDLVYTSSTHIMGSLWYIDNIGDNASISLAIPTLNQSCIYVIGFTDQIPRGWEPCQFYVYAYSARADYRLFMPHKYEYIECYQNSGAQIQLSIDNTLVTSNMPLNTPYEIKDKQVDMVLYNNRATGYFKLY